eukprot:scaffold495032_cov16-Prasinocladus_malaysianus.AAC.1
MTSVTRSQARPGDLTSRQLGSRVAISSARVRFTWEQRFHSPQPLKGEKTEGALPAAINVRCHADWVVPSGKSRRMKSADIEC